MCPFLIVLQLFSQSGKEINQKALFCTEKVLVLAFNKITFDTVSFLSANAICIISQSAISQRLFVSGYCHFKNDRYPPLYYQCLFFFPSLAICRTHLLLNFTGLLLPLTFTSSYLCVTLPNSRIRLEFHKSAHFLYVLKGTGKHTYY